MKSLDDKTINKQIGASIRVIRKALNISLDELSKILEITPGYMGLIERGQRGATLSRLLKICSLYGCTLDELVGGNSCANSSYQHINQLIAYMELANMHDEVGVSFLIDIVKAVKNYQSRSLHGE